MLKDKNETLRQLQCVEYEMLCKFADICEKYNLTYFLEFGTLLGAVRHQGFIPWDDDIDISMPVDDYNKFLQVAQEELGDQYFLQTSDTDNDYHYSFAKIRKNGTTLYREQFKNWKVHQGVWIDIFPLIDTDPGIAFKTKQCVHRICTALLLDSYLIANSDEYVENYGKFTTSLLKLVYKIPQSLRLKFKNFLLNKILFNTKPKKGKAVLWVGITRYMTKELYEGSDKLLFEGRLFNVPSKYKEILECVYGDYMQLPPVEQRRGHGHDIIDLENDYTKYLNK